ncbi:MAG: DUF86 domain-containing protein [Gammaproteobacteria bacterium]|nr:DUF86 domain-containing protein [Gammaproteobacteria bacterium]
MSERRWDIYVRDMLHCCNGILMHTAGLDRELVFRTRVVLDATLWNIAMLGEAAGNVPKPVQNAHPEIPWRTIISAGNRVIHGYGDIDEDVAWDIVSHEIPELIPQLRALLEEAEREGGADPP